jgi:hypothetical protein
MKTCQKCQKQFVPLRKAKGMYCSHDCMNEHRKSTFPEWFQCSCCMAKIGFGVVVAGRLLGKNKSSVYRVWQKAAIKPQLPEAGEWRRHAKRLGAFDYDEGKWWGKNADGWMTDYTPKFFDWSSIWSEEKMKRRYHSLSPEKKAERNKRSYAKRKERWATDDDYRARSIAYQKEWNKRNKKKARGYQRKSIAKRKLIDPGFKIQNNLRNRFKDLMKTTQKGGTKNTSSLLGCSTKQLAKHLESQFKRGITWENYGTEWHVDHIIPCASFDHSDPRQVAQCWHWTNLRPLRADENLKKGASITDPQMSLLFSATG